MPESESKLSTPSTVVLCLFFLAFGALEMMVPAMSESDIEVDGLIPVFKALDKHPRGVVFSLDIQVMRMLPTWANQGTLLDIGGTDFAGTSREKRKEFLFAYLYYSNVPTLEDALQSKTFLGGYAASTVFGKERVVPEIRGSRPPVTAGEIETASREYASYVERFDHHLAQKHLITYLVAEDGADLSRIDRWYNRVPIELHDGVTIYRLSLK